MSVPIQINKAKYFLIAEGLDWEVGEHHLIGKEYNDLYLGYQNQGFSKIVEGRKLPTNLIIQEVIGTLQTKQPSQVLGNSYQYNVEETLMEAANLINFNLFFIRETIFEEIRKEHFPHLPSRQKAIWVIPAEKETLKSRLSQIKNPNAQVFELSLMGKIHRSIPKALDLHSFSPEMVRKNAYRYWIGTMGENTPNDDIIFEGVATVLKVIDAKSIAS